MSPVSVELRGDVAVITIDEPPVNASTAEVRAGLLAAVRARTADPATKAIVLTGAGKHFVAGSDLREFDGPIADPDLPTVLAALEDSAVPVVAALHGSALGGGFELALACDARIAAADTVVGLPEVTLGMVPGAGGTQRLPRLTGRTVAIDLVCSGRRVDAEEAHRLGILDLVVPRDVLDAACGFARGLAGRRRLSQRPIPPELEADVESAADAARRLAPESKGIPAAIELIRGNEPFDAGLRNERRVFHELRESPEAKALRYVFFAERAAARAGRSAQARHVERAGVIGAGTMGTEIALLLATNRVPVTLVDTHAEAMKRARETVTSFFADRVGRGKLSAADATAMQKLVRFGDSIAEMSKVDFVVEAVAEDLAVKKEVLSELAEVTPAGTVIASNTSYLDITALATATRRPEDVVGMHFFHPARVMRLVEVIPGQDTSSVTTATVHRFAARLGKIAIRSGNAEGFIGNRIYSAYRSKAETLVLHGALPSEVDEAMRAFGFAMGPFAVADASGLDVAWRMRQRRRAEGTLPADSTLADELCERGRFGVKTGAGWHRYERGSRKPRPDPEVEAMIVSFADGKGVARRTFTAEEIQRNLLTAIVAEARRVVAAGIAAGGADIDLVWLHGYGFPRHRGGPVFWARHRGIVNYTFSSISAGESW